MCAPMRWRGGRERDHQTGGSVDGGRRRPAGGGGRSGRVAITGSEILIGGGVIEGSVIVIDVGEARMSPFRARDCLHDAR